MPPIYFETLPVFQCFIEAKGELAEFFGELRSPRGTTDYGRAVEFVDSPHQY